MGTILHWTVSRTAAYHKEGKDMIIRINARTGQLLQEKELYGSSFTHEAVRTRDGKFVLVADTKGGNVLVLLYPSMAHFKTIDLFTRQDHINTLHPTPHGTFWVLLHGRARRSSRLVEVDINSEQVIRIVRGYGDGAHGIVMLPSAGQRGDVFVYLNSNVGTLVSISIPKRTGTEKLPIELTVEPQTLWRSSSGAFLKGICVVDGIIYFGSSAKSRDRTARMRVPASLFAFDMDSRRLLWVRSHSTIGTVGLINTIAAPSLSIAATYIEMHSNDISPTNAWARFSTTDVQAHAPTPADMLLQRKHISSVALTALCVKGRARLEDTRSMRNMSESRVTLNAAFYRLPLQFDSALLLAEFSALQRRSNWTARPDINNSFIQLVSPNGNASDEKFGGPMRPVDGRLSDMPYTSKVLNSLSSFIGRDSFYDDSSRWKRNPSPG